jgi:hypothetical protein
VDNRERVHERRSDCDLEEDLSEAIGTGGRVVVVATVAWAMSDSPVYGSG